ncbi:MAG: hypothetical protein WCS85_05975 [Candidatus Peribacteraceae bacterium]|jgi:hypothetical protein
MKTVRKFLSLLFSVLAILLVLTAIHWRAEYGNNDEDGLILGAFVSGAVVCIIAAWMLWQWPRLKPRRCPCI